MSPSLFSLHLSLIAPFKTLLTPKETLTFYTAGDNLIEILRTNMIRETNRIHELAALNQMAFKKHTVLQMYQRLITEDEARSFGSV
jgi:hypothetical protein